MTRTRTVKQAADTTPAPAPKPVKKTTAKRTPAARPARKRTSRKATGGTPKLSLVEPPKTLPARTRDWMTDAQIHATLTAHTVGITTIRIRDWRDHRDGTATRRLRDGSTLHYNHTTRTLTWQAVCRMGAIHQYHLTSRSMACAARLHADACTALHADLSTIPPLTADELAALGLLHTPTWARPDLIGDQITETIPVPLPDRQPRALADQLTHSHTSTTDTQPLNADDLVAGLAERAADTETPKEHPHG